MFAFFMGGIRNEPHRIARTKRKTPRRSDGRGHLRAVGHPHVSGNVERTPHPRFSVAGTLQKLVCPRCGATLDSHAFVKTIRPLYAAHDMVGLQKAFSCRCGGMWDTDVVLYGDAVRGIDRACALAEDCDLMLVIGSSLTTYPAAALPDIARQSGAKVVLINEDCVGALTDVA